MPVHSLLIYGLYVLGLMLVILTVLPFWKTTRWWVRICDFPRSQIAICAAILVVVLAVIGWPLSPADAFFLSLVVLAAAWQLSWIWRYLPGSPIEVPNADNTLRCVRFMTTNVYQPCRDSAGLMEIISDADPDILLAVETDEWWCEQLKEGLNSRYPHSLLYPLSNGYGMALYSRYELIDPEIRFLVDEAIPSIKTGVLLRSGAVIDLYGLHPQPPAPDQSSMERDTELVLAGKEVQKGQRPAVLLGDLNDVAWSQTTLRFREEGELRDPRRGRGFFNTYPAGMPFLRYPLDYVFHTDHFAVREMRVLPRYQSDHLPLLVALCVTESSDH
jgi:endonuclease/exonuclease/phosphatase (EEP) superfamily protein YafD